jgi:hypothetical protein
MNKTITLQYKNKKPLNAVADFILLEKPHLFECLDEIKMITEAPVLFGSGEDTIVTIVLKYTNPTKENLADIEEIIAIAKKFGSLDGANEIDIYVDGSDGS